MEWISVKDRLPEDGKDYLVTDGDACMVAVYKNGIKKWDFFVYDHCWYSEDVTHWMPLPPPPNK
jgi:hypothetical protein